MIERIVSDLYNEQEQKKIETVLSIFQDYICSKKNIEVLWSEKTGYVFATLFFLDDGTLVDSYFKRIPSAAFFLEAILAEMFDDVYLAMGLHHLVNIPEESIQKAKDDANIMFQNYLREHNIHLDTL